MLNKYLNLLTGAHGDAQDVPAAACQDVTSVLDAAAERGQATLMLRRFLGHQPVLDATSQIVGYELNIREPGLFAADGEAAQRWMQDEALVISVIDLDFQQALGNKLTFIGVAPSMLDNPIVDQLPQHRVVVAIRLAGEVGESLLARCRELVAAGIELALDDFECRPEHEPFLKLCHYVRIDTTRYDALALGQQVAQIRGMGSPRLVARNVETEDAFEAYRALSFELFQGYYFARMQPALPHRLDNDRMRVMELLNMVMNRAELAELEEKVKLDPGLSYKLLNFINSPANGLQQKIRSIGHVLTLLGYDQLYRWLTLLLFSSGKSDSRNRSLLKSALVRARFMETLGKSRFAAAEQGGLFIVGIFSLLDVLLNVPMAQALARLNLPQAVVDALLHQSGIYAPYLQLVMACENFDQELIARYAATCGLNADEVNVTHVKALIWGEGVDI